MRDFEKLPLVAIRTPCFDSGCGGNLEMRTALFWVIAHRVGVIFNRRFGTTYRSHSQGLGGFLNPEDGTDKLCRNFGKKLPLVVT